MGCAASRLEDEEAVKMCRDRRDSIREALEQRNRFATSHIAYIESLKRVSMALQRFVAMDDHQDLIFDPFISPVKQHKPEMLGLPYGSYEKRTVHVSKYLMSGPNPSVSVEEQPRPVETVRIDSHYPMDSNGGTDRFFAARSSSSPMEPSSYYTPPYDRPNYPPSSSQEPVRNSSYYTPPYVRPSYPPPSPQEPVRNSSYYMPYDRPNYAPASSPPGEPMRTSYYAPYDRPNYAPASSPPGEPMRNSYYAPYDRPNYAPASSPPQEPMRNSYYAPYDRPGYPPPSPQDQEPPQWDFFWNPFSSLDTVAYPRPRSGYDNVVTDDELARLQQVREEEGIPELEEEDGECEEHEDEQMHHKEEEEEEEDGDDDDGGGDDDDDDEDDECDHSDEKHMASDEGAFPVNTEANAEQETKGVQSKGVQCAEVSEPPDTVQLEIKAQKNELMRNKVANAEKKPGFTVYVNRRPASLVEAMKDIDSHFLGICNAAQEISQMLEASRAQYSTSNDLSVKMLNPVALLRSASSRSSSSRFLLASTSSIEDLYDNETSSCYSEESCSTMSGSHHSTLDRLYTWEKKLYKEVKVGERLRIDYEKRLAHLRNQDVKGDEPSSVDKTRAALRSLNTRMKVSIHTVQSISRRIEVVRDEELQHQLMELIQGLSRMWRAMAERHTAQKRTIDDAKLLFIHQHPSPATALALSVPDGAGPPPAAVALEYEVRAWRGALEAWLSAQRAYARAMAAWARRCLGGGDVARAHAHAALPLAFVLCMEWARVAEAASEARVMDGLDFFIAGVGSVCSGIATDMEGGMAGRVLCAGMAAVIGSMAEFAEASADSYDALVAAVAAARAPERGKEENALAQPQQ